MKRIILQLTLCLFARMAFAQGTLQGSVHDEKNEPLIGATVYIEASGTGAVTDRLGQYSIAPLHAGRHAVRVSYIGYETQRSSVVIADKQTTRFNVSLAMGNGVQLADITVTGGVERPLNTLSQVDIRLRPVNTAQDILRMVPGLFIAQHAGGGKAEQVFIRGFDADHGTDINIEVDGMPVNMVSHAHGQGYADLHFLIPELVSHVDFDKGPYFADKGDFTTGGYVDFQTRNKLERNFARLEGGSFGAGRAVAGVNVLNRQRSSAYIASEFSRTNGFFENSQHFRRFNVQGKFNTQLNEDTQLSLGLSVFDSQWDASGQIPERAVSRGIITRFGSLDPTEGGETGRINVNLKASHTLRNGATLENQVYAFRYRFNLFSNFTFYLNHPDTGDQIQQQEHRWVYGYRTRYSHTSTLGNLRLQTEGGVGFRYDVIDNIALSNTTLRVFVSDLKRGDIREGNAHAYWSETLWLAPKFSVNAAVRFDYFHFAYTDRLSVTQPESKGQGIVSPKLNFNYQPTESVNLFVRTGTGFHSNDAHVVVEQLASETLPRAYGIDIGADIKVTPLLLVHTALWRLDLDQEFVYVGDEAVVEPSGKTKREGIDLSVRYQLAPWLFADADVNVTHPRAKGAAEGENYIPLAPTVTSIGGLSVRRTRGFNGSLRYRYLGDRPANETNTVVATGYFIADAILNFTRPGYEFGVSAENIFNMKWNEAQFDTESRLLNEAAPVSEIHFTPGTPFAVKVRFTKYF
ncbi:TonB-dependent receptor [Chryseolinea lacunae]|uniref:TonB-dependent receptor n=1 Tax=Chryseolinea lacunae TaxID=2801331 RepID=A0ABS1KPY1_9BACT|nr:TonB-dependent receptor [Chryseolinea lacunae]MBL0740752.1 TonB-dependent receptor [Chryseolinea lacunae]